MVRHSGIGFDWEGWGYTGTSVSPSDIYYIPNGYWLKSAKTNTANCILRYNDGATIHSWTIGTSWVNLDLLSDGSDTYISSADVTERLFYLIGIKKKAGRP